MCRYASAIERTPGAGRQSNLFCGTASSRESTFFSASPYTPSKSRGNAPLAGAAGGAAACAAAVTNPSIRPTIVVARMTFFIRISLLNCAIDAFLGCRWGGEGTRNPAGGSQPLQRLALKFEELVAGSVVGVGDDGDAGGRDLEDVVARAPVGRAIVGCRACSHHGNARATWPGQIVEVIAMVVPVQHQIRAGAREHGLHRRSITQVALLTMTVDERRVVNQHHAPAASYLGRAQERFQSKQLGVAHASPGAGVARGHARAGAHQGDIPAKADKGIDGMVRAQLGRLIGGEHELAPND